jgi:hypothetical protein
MLGLIQAHPYISGMLAMLVFSTAVGALPTPKDNSSQFYEFVFKFFTGLLGGLFRVIAIYKPDWMSVLGQQPKTTIPPNPPIAQGEEPASKLNEVKP